MRRHQNRLFINEGFKWTGNNKSVHPVRGLQSILVLNLKIFSFDVSNLDFTFISSTLRMD